ncbi:YisL family protein [Brevibacillus gelatini]|uniref:YisL family protein n=1 Tax=Brevibacillus gelatini TaxID=1655277 RepID=UPI003D81A41A
MNAVPYKALLESHVGSWEVAIVLLIVAYFLYRAGKEKAGKIVHMLLRLMMVIILVSGAWMLFTVHASEVYYYVKGLIAIVAFSLIEMSLGRAKRQEASMGFFIGCLVALVVVIMLGYRVFS